MNKIDHKSTEFITWAKENYLQNPAKLMDIFIEVDDYLRMNLMFQNLKLFGSLCVDKMEKGALEHGTRILEDPLVVEVEMRAELIDLVNYLIMKKYQQSNGQA